MLHYPGDLNTQKMIEEGFLWSSKDGFIGESCLGYLYCKFAKLATLFGITTAEDNEREREREREFRLRPCHDLDQNNNTGGTRETASSW